MRAEACASARVVPGVLELFAIREQSPRLPPSPSCRSRLRPACRGRLGRPIEIGLPGRSSKSEGWSGSRDLHPDRRVHNAECCSYTTILMACQALAGRRKPACRAVARRAKAGAPGRTRTDDYEFTKLALWLLRHGGAGKCKMKNAECKRADHRGADDSQ